MDNSIEYYKNLLLILKGCALVIKGIGDNTCYIDCMKLRNLPITDDMATDLLLSGYVRLDTSNSIFEQTNYIRKDSWENDLDKLKIKCPQLFRKSKINKLLKNDK